MPALILPLERIEVRLCPPAEQVQDALPQIDRGQLAFAVPWQVRVERNPRVFECFDLAFV